MSTQYAGSSASYPANVELPSDNDPDDAASVNRGLQDLADRTEYLKDKKVSKDGEVLTPTTQFEVGGAGMNISGPSQLANCTNLTVNGPSQLNGTLAATGNATLGGTLDVTGNATMGGTLDVTGDTSVGGTLDVTGDVTLTEPLDAHAGDLPFLRLKRLVKNSGTALAVTDGQLVILGYGSPTTVTVADDVNGTGAFMVLHCSAGGATVSLEDAAANPITSLAAGETAIIVSGGGGTFGLLRKW